MLQPIQGLIRAMRIRLKLFFVLLLLGICFCTASSADIQKPVKKFAVKTFTLNQLAKINTAVLTGSKPSYILFIPVPNQWNVDTIDLNLIIQFSPLLLTSSSLTLMVGDTPIESIHLDNKQSKVDY